MKERKSAQTILQRITDIFMISNLKFDKWCHSVMKLSSILWRVKGRDYKANIQGWSGYLMPRELDHKVLKGSHHG